MIQVACHNNQSITENPKKVNMDLVGFWHAVPSVAAGYEACYVFSADGKYIYYPNNSESNYWKGVIGNWSVSNDILNIKPDGEEEVQNIKLGIIEKADDSPYEWKVSLGGEYFWKISNDPKWDGYKENDSLENENQEDSEFEIYVNKRYGFNIKYPVSWNIFDESPSSDGVVLYNKLEDDIRVYGGYLLGDSTDTMAIDEAKNNGLKIEEYLTSEGVKGYKILSESGDKVIIHFIVYGSEVQCHLYVNVSLPFYEENKLVFNNMAKSINVNK